MQNALQPDAANTRRAGPVDTFRRVRRLVTVAWVLFASAVIALAFWQSVSSSRHAFEQMARDFADAVTERALVAETAIEAFAAFVTSQSPFDHRAAADFAGALASRYPFLYKFEVAQQVTHAEREALERRLSAIYPDFEVLQFDYADTREWRRAPVASDYFPIIFQEPYFNDERQVVGLDLNSSPFLIEAMQASFRLGLPMATRPFTLAENVSGYVIHRALDRRPGSVAAPLTAGRYALLALRTDRFIGDVAEQYQAMAITLSQVGGSQSLERSFRLLNTPGRDATALERLFFPRFRQSLSLTKAVPSQPFEVSLAWQMSWRDLNLSLLVGLILVAALAPSIARRFSLAYFEHQMASLDSDGELYQMANYDALTGVANRHRLIDQLEIALLRAARDRTRFCVLFIDIDGFKQINDRLGHAAGDAILVAFCERLGGVLRSDEMLGRLGGDEFVVVTGDSNGAPDIGTLIDRIKTEASAPLDYRRQQVIVDFSVGHACYPADGRSVAALLDVADSRMYREKQRHPV